jgi:hypothetical protein
MNCRSPRLQRAVAIGALAFALSSTGPALACGLEDPSSIAILRGSLNIAYPESLHVGTAIWQAQLAGQLPRDPLAQQGDLTPEQRSTLRLIRANVLIRQLAAKLPEAGSAPRPTLAVVLLGPVMWSRFEAKGGGIQALPHAPGPERGDVVVVTDLAVVDAIAKGTLTFSGALSSGLMRLYGPSPEVAAARSWLSDRAPG